MVRCRGLAASNVLALADMDLGDSSPRGVERGGGGGARPGGRTLTYFKLNTKDSLRAKENHYLPSMLKRRNRKFPGSFGG